MNKIIGGKCFPETSNDAWGHYPDPNHVPVIGRDIVISKNRLGQPDEKLKKFRREVLSKRYDLWAGRTGIDFLQVRHK